MDVIGGLLFVIIFFFMVIYWITSIKEWLERRQVSFERAQRKREIEQETLIKLNFLLKEGVFRDKSECKALRKEYRDFDKWVREVNSRHHKHILFNELKSISIDFYLENKFYAENFAMYAFKALTSDNAKWFSYNSFLSESKWIKKVLNSTNAFDRMTDKEKFEIIQDYIFSYYRGISVPVKQAIIEGGKKKLQDDERNRKAEDIRRMRERTEKQEKAKIAAEEWERTRVRSSTAGKLISKSITKVIDNYCTYAGVYLVVNNITLDFYIGESQNISFRRLTHLGELADPVKSHHRYLMQEHYNKYGAGSFDFYVLERVDHDTVDGTARKRLEAFYIKEYSPTYN
ncbi:MAG: hypothetical protein NT040_08115 [Bacteroidetes bacterium]|nr:hypothetical protein [Bacteroidota bacterium]